MGSSSQPVSWGQSSVGQETSNNRSLHSWLLISGGSDRQLQLQTIKLIKLLFVMQLINHLESGA